MVSSAAAREEARARVRMVDRSMVAVVDQVELMSVDIEPVMLSAMNVVVVLEIATLGGKTSF